MNTQKHKNIVLILALLAIFIRTFVSNVYPVILPELKTYFATNRQAVELSISLFFTGLGISQLFYGTLSDRFGRRKILLLGESIFLFGFIGGLFSKTITSFVAFSVVQGLGAGCAFSITAAILRDMYTTKEVLSARYSLMEATYGAALVLAPFMGGYIQHYFTWTGVFTVIIAFTALLILFLFLLLEETNLYASKIRFEEILKNYICMGKDLVFSCLLMILTFSAVFTVFFNQVSPFLSLYYFHLSSVKYGQFMMLVGMFYMLGVFFNIYLSKITTLYKKITYGFILCLLIYLGMLTAVTFNFINVYTLFLPRCLSLFAWGLIYPNIKTIAMTCYPKSQGGTCGAYIGFFMYFATSVITAIFAKLDIRTLEKFVYINIFLSVVGFLTYLIIYKRIRTREANGIQISSGGKTERIS